ncbi:MAG: tetratricopeptide repeat protein [Planctomycetota bacterium]
MLIRQLLLGLLLVVPVCCYGIDIAAQEDLIQEISSELRKGRYEEAQDAAKRLLKAEPRVEVKLFIADTLLRCGDAKTSLKLFDQYVEAKPDSEPYLWQRGIAQYFVGEYKAGVDQFEIHRKVNPNDVENAAWHFLCLAKNQSPKEAKALLLPAPGDPRPPMAEVLEMLRSGDKSIVKQKIESFDEGSRSRGTAEFYGWFYLGLYEDALGDKAKAAEWLKKSASVAPRNYMGGPCLRRNLAIRLKARCRGPQSCYGPRA